MAGERNIEEHRSAKSLFHLVGEMVEIAISKDIVKLYGIFLYTFAMNLYKLLLCFRVKCIDNHNRPWQKGLFLMYLKMVWKVLCSQLCQRHCMPYFVFCVWDL